MVVQVWTDGCCLGNNWLGGDRRAGIGFCFNQQSGLGSYYGPVELDHGNSPTNNTAEWQAVINAVIVAKSHGHTELDVFTDSEYIYRAWNQWMPGWEQNGWRKADGSPLVNITWIKQLDRLERGMNISIQWIPRYDNEKADALANLATDVYLNKDTNDGNEMYNLLNDHDCPETAGIFTCRKVAILNGADIPVFLDPIVEGHANIFCVSSLYAHGMVKVPSCQTYISGDRSFYIPVKNMGFTFHQDRNVRLNRDETLRLLLPRGVKVGEALLDDPYRCWGLPFPSIDNRDHCNDDFDDDQIEFL